MATALLPAAASAASSRRLPGHGGGPPAYSGPIRAYLVAHRPPRGAASAPLTLPHSRAHGVVYRRGSKQAQLIKADCTAACVGPLFYYGGPVMRTPKAYAIFWQPESKEAGPNEQSGTLEKFPGGYEAVIDGFMSNVQLSSADSLSSVFSVDLLYGDTEGRGGYGWQFGGAYTDKLRLPQRSELECPKANAAEEASEKEGKPGLPPGGEGCVTDRQIQEQIEYVVKHTAGLSGGLGALYFIFTPPHLNSCAGGKEAAAECTTNSYCAYHSDISKVEPHIVYANMPYGDRSGCATPDQPNTNPADDEINLISHEGNEAITDPLIAEANEEREETEPKIGWISYSGNEVGDLCTYPFFDSAIDVGENLDAYGPLLGGTPGYYEEGGQLRRSVEFPGTAFNQELGTGHYLLQREWSDAAEGCVARAPTPTAAFSDNATPGAPGKAVSFQAAGSSPGAGRLSYYRWEFGDGGGAVGESAPSHAYASPGTYTVTLTVANNSGASATTSQQVTIAAPPAPAPPVVTTTTTTTTVTTSTTVTRSAPQPPVAHYSSSDLARLLRLPSPDARLPGLGSIVLGHAGCGPACTTAVRVLAVVRAGRHLKRISIGSSTLRLTEGKFGAVTVRLSRRGVSLLRKRHVLSASLLIVIEDREGATWRIARAVKLTLGGKAARSERRRRARQARRRRGGR